MMRRTFIVLSALAALTACGNQNDAADPTAAAPISTVSPGVASPGVTTTTASQPAVAAPPTSTEISNAPTENAVAITAVDPADFPMENRAGVAWVSPSGNIYCHITEGEFSSGCQANDAPVPAGANCTNPTFTIDQLTKGFFLAPSKVTPTCFNQGVFGGDPKQILPYDHSISYDGYTCTSREAAMVCDAGGGHGFVLSKEEATWN